MNDNLILIIAGITMAVCALTLVGMGVYWLIAGGKPPVDSPKKKAAPVQRDPVVTQWNPYATIALVSAMLGLFWIAIVYGILALRRAGGRGQAIAALVLGFLELLALIVVISVISQAFSS